MKLTKDQFKFWDDNDNELVIEYDPKECSSKELADYILDCQEKAIKWDNELITPKLFDVFVFDTTSEYEIPYDENGEFDFKKLIDSYQENKQLKKEILGEKS